MKNILVVDNDVRIQDQLKTYFKKHNGIVTSAENGFEGIKAFKGKKFDLVITDIIMPVQDGLELIRGIRRINTDVPIIVNCLPVDGIAPDDHIMDEYKVECVLEKSDDLELFDAAFKQCKVRKLVKEQERLEREKREKEEHEKRHRVGKRVS